MCQNCVRELDQLDRLQDNYKNRLNVSIKKALQMPYQIDVYQDFERAKISVAHCIPYFSGIRWTRSMIVTKLFYKCHRAASHWNTEEYRWHAVAVKSILYHDNECR